jgi:hypothetical protein
MSTQYRLVQAGRTASSGCSAGQGSSEPVAPRIIMKPWFKNYGVDAIFNGMTSKLNFIKSTNWFKS